jgi:hypothetical protein
LLYARGADARAHTVKKKENGSDEQIKDLIIQDFQENASIFWRLLFARKDIMRNFFNKLPQKVS